MLERHHAIAVLYFLEEALGYRQSLHWLRRYWETSEPSDLRALIKEVCRENFIHADRWAKIDTVSLDEAKSWTGKKTLLDLIDDLGDFVLVVGDYFEDKTWLVSRLARSIERCPDANWKDALSRNQIRSKLWLLDKVDQQGWLDADEIILIGGWLGLLPFLSGVQGKKLNTVTNIDLDTTCHPAALTLNRDLHQRFINLGDDVRTLDFSKKQDALIIDTIVEHFQDHGTWIKTLPKNTRMVLQGNDMFGLPDHVNCHDNLEEFVGSCGLGQIHWYGQMEQLGCTRYMVLGQV